MSDFTIKVILISWLVLGALATVGSIGKARKPTTPGLAVVVLLGNALVIWGIVSLGGAS